nr:MULTISPECIES: hypothetical protein [Streptomyces]
MLPSSSQPGPQTTQSFDEQPLLPPFPHHRGAGLGAAAAYTAFCHDHRPVYEQYAGAVTGSTPCGLILAHEALRELAAQWPAAQRGAGPCVLGWSLLRATTAPSRTSTVRTLQRNLSAREADALVLHYRLGLTAQRGGCAMGVSPSAFELLRRIALRRAADLDWGRHMPVSDAP